MPKYDILLKPGESIPDDIRDFLQHHFKPATLDKLLKHGGLVRVSVAAPYTPGRGKNQKKIAIDETFLNRLHEVQNNAEALQAELATLSIKHLKSLCQLIGQPVRTSASAQELRSQIVTSIRAADFWQRISKSTTP